MAEQGMFTGLNAYEAELIDNANQREASSANVGTGWQAITNAAGRAGGMLGRSVGRGLGGVTTAEQRVTDFQEITASIPDFDPSKPESLQEMSSALWQGGFYDQAKNMMDTANVYSRNLAELANLEAQTGSIVAGDTLAEMKFNLSKTYTETQMEQINQAIAASKAGVSNQEILTDLKSVFQDVDIRRIEQVINASKSQVELAEQQMDLNTELNAANIEKIQQEISASKSGVTVDEARIRGIEQDIIQSEAMIGNLDKTELSKNYKFAVANGEYDGSFTDYQKLISNLKTIQKESSISLYEYAQSTAGGSYKGTLEDFVTSITGVDYKRAVAARAASETSYSPPGKTELDRIVKFVDKDIDFGIKDFSGKDGEEGLYTENDIAVQLYYLAKNRGVTPDSIWNEFKNLENPLQSIMATAVNTASGGQGAGQGSGSSALMIQETP
ncbi:hypothetical protein OAT80_02415 [Flavobacteriaceae bacterium]|nr:hypothetical protein [Flavobacteriaceae bacterium]